MNERTDYFKNLVINTLAIGKENAIKQSDIADKTGLNKREIRRIMQSLRHDGYPICSTTYDGYWLAKNKEDIEQSLTQLSAQVKTLQETIVALLDTKAKMFEE